MGGLSPRVKNDKTKIKILVKDSLGNKYTKIFYINVVELSYAKRFSSNFGDTLALMEDNPLEIWEQ